MKTDKELLELAAKAAGYETKLEKHSMEVRIKSGSIWPCWNPLDDDGQALRLAVNLDIAVIQDKENGCAIYISGGDSVRVWDKDPYAATRRAIVRAAAAIGEML